MLNSAALREQFPVLSRRINGRPIIYLDNAATSLKPQRVLQEEMNYYSQCGANIHRAKHALSLEASELYEAARDTVAQFLGAAAPAEIVFTASATEALNMVAQGLGLCRRDEVLATTLEHHSNLVPWMREARVRLVPAPPDLPVDPADVARAMGEHTKVIAISLASNTTGVIQPVREICRLARERGVLTVVDAAQAVAHLPVDVQELGCDFLVFSGHKVFGPTGTGVLYGRQERLDDLEPLRLGGGSVDRVTAETYALRSLPHRLEAGTPNIAGVVGLAAALRFVRDAGFPQLVEHGEMLAAALAHGLTRVPGIRVLMARHAPRLPLASIVLEKIHLSADDVAMMLSDRHGIMTRSGFFCAHPFFDAVDVQQGALRPSALLYNTRAEVEMFCAALEETVAPFRR